MPAPGQSQRATSKFIVFEQFEKMNTQSVRQALSEKELSWLENLQPIAGNNLTTVPGPSAALTSISGSITAQYFANLGTVDYIISFPSDGSAWATNLANAVSTQFAPPGTYTAPDMTVWQAAVVLIADGGATLQTYSAWNGTVLVQRGGVSPVISVTNGGTGYTSPPAVSITGGSGSGATAVATVGTPAVTAVNVINGGSGYTSAPAVVFSGGGGTGAAATANVNPQSVNTITLTNTGSDQYLSGPMPSVTISFGGPGTGAAAVANVGPSPGFSSSHWFVFSVSITNGGTGYTSPPTITFSSGAPVGSSGPATATCTVGNGAVTSITITNGGGGYTSAPGVALTGGGGSGATAAAVIGGSGVVTVNLTNAGSGYLPSDTLTVGFSGGGGTGAAATAKVWPFVGGGTIAIFQGRVWLGFRRNVQFSGTGGYDDFSAAGASGAFNINDADLVHQVTALRTYNNYLFIMGDQSVKQIGNISLNAAGTVTLFTILTLSSDVGTIYPRSCGSFNRIFMFANPTGIYAVLGSSVQKISDDLDGIWKLVDFSQQPQAAILDINNIHNISWLVRYKDPLATTRSIMLTFNGKKWFVVSQGDSVKAIVTASTLASGKTFPYASSGQDITNILSQPNVPVTFKIQTALTHHGNAVQRKKSIRNGMATNSPAPSVPTLVLDSDEGSQTYTHAMTGGFNALSWSADGSGKYLGATIIGTLANFTVNNATIEYQETNTGNK